MEKRKRDRGGPEKYQNRLDREFHRWVKESDQYRAGFYSNKIKLQAHLIKFSILRTKK